MARVFGCCDSITEWPDSADSLGLGSQYCTHVADFPTSHGEPSWLQRRKEVSQGGLRSTSQVPSTGHECASLLLTQIFSWSVR